MSRYSLTSYKHLLEIRIARVSIVGRFTRGHIMDQRTTSNARSQQPVFSRQMLSLGRQSFQFDVDKSVHSTLNIVNVL